MALFSSNSIAAATGDELHETKSGILYRIHKLGFGQKPTRTDFVTVIYTGYLEDGTIFDSSNSEEVTFQLSRTIKGWQEAIPLMSPGAEYAFLIPAHLAYGNMATGKIPPNSPLIFSVKLIATKKAL